jgi:hypothetical protein
VAQRVEQRGVECIRAEGMRHHRHLAADLSHRLLVREIDRVERVFREDGAFARTQELDCEVIRIPELRIRFFDPIARAAAA